MCPIRQSHDINLSKTDKEANGHGNGDQSLGTEHDGTSLKVKVSIYERDDLTWNWLDPS